MQINGIGTTLLGVSPQDRANTATATLWFTFVFLPCAPLRRYRVRFLPHTGSGYSYEVLERTPLKVSEILRTYVAGWLGAPLLLFGPLALGITEIWEVLRLPPDWQMPYIIFGILWLGVAIWLLFDKLEKRCHPRNLSVAGIGADMPFTPPRQKFPWRAMAWPLVFIGVTVAAALGLLVTQLPPASWLIAAQVYVFGGYHFMLTFVVVWMGVVALGLVGLEAVVSGPRLLRVWWGKMRR